MVLRTNFKAYKVVSSEKKFFSKIGNFLTFFAYPGSQISWKMTNFFFERYGPEIFRGLHKWCFERILRRFRLFRAKKIFFENSRFFDFFAYPGSQISWKMTNFFFERYQPEICRGLHKWCCEQILRHLSLFGAKKKFLTIFAYHRSLQPDFYNQRSQISWKMTNYFFERYRPEICRGLHKWCCEKILRYLRLFWAKKFFFENWKFFDFFCISGVTDFLKNDQLLFWEIPAWNLSWTAQMVLRTNFKAFKVVSSEKKNFFKNWKFFDFFCISGVTDFLKNDQLLFWEILAWNLSWTAQMVLRTNYKAFWVVSSEKKNFSKILKFFDLFCISRVTDFLKNDQLLFWEIGAWNFSWTAQMVLRKNFKVF